MSDSPELLKPSAEVINSELQIELGNLKVENERLQTNYAALLESSTAVTNKLRGEVQELRSQLEKELADREEIEAELQKAKDEAEDSLYLRAQYHADLIMLQNKHKEVEAELSDLKQKSATAGKDLPDAADLLNQLKAKRKKSSVMLSDVEKILEILGGDDD